ncbi:MAG: aspartate kinase [Oxalobacter sp.]|nr:aspartate kinase [Oxalobacter sp.]
MALVVHKYGGTSMGSIDRIKNVARRVAKWHDAGYQVVVVPSAMAGETNRLIGLAREIMPEPDQRELDMISSTGEQVSIGLLSLALQQLGKQAVSFTGWQVPVVTDTAHTKARIHSIDDRKIRENLDQGKIVIVAGFQGVNELNEITTLGRGGSDTSAVAIAASLKADECLIYTDVDGVYTTDPRVVSDARRLRKITFEEMLEMASLGSKVLQTRSVELAGSYHVPTRVLSSLTDPEMPLEEEAKSGTLITFEEEHTDMESTVISGIAFSRDEAKITVLGVPDRPGIASQILGAIANANIEVDMIIQNQSVGGKTDFTFTVPRPDYNRAMDILNNQVKGEIGASDIIGDAKVSKVSAIGIGMRSHVGVASKMFSTLFSEGINILMISTSEIKISVIIDEKYMELAVRALHKAFGLEK